MNFRQIPRGRRLRLALLIGCIVPTMMGCENILEVDLPASVTDDVLDRPDAAEGLRNSIITHFESGWNTFVWQAFGHEDGGQGMGAGSRNALLYNVNAEWFADISRSRKFAFDLHDRLSKDWTPAQVPEHAKTLAVSSIYAGANLGWTGMAMCEATMDLGKMMTPTETLALADQWLTQALTEISKAGGDFAMPFGIATSAETMTYGLRAQVRWMKGDNAGALADAKRVPQGFTAYVLREAGPARRNTPYYLGSFQHDAEVSGVNDWWKGPNNPVTNQPWATPIPFTGWLDLGILPDGRAVRDDGLPIRTAGPYRTPIESTAVADTRVKTAVTSIVSSKPGPTPVKYSGEADDLPLVSWREMFLIRAEIEGGQTAIDLVNALRTAAGLPKVTYANPNNAQQIKYMIIEERRRALYLEGHYYFTKLKNPDLLWFPRAVGQTTNSGWNLAGGVSFIMPNQEYLLNPNLSLDVRATGCAAGIRPVKLDTAV